MNYTSVLMEKGYFDERPVLRIRDAALNLSARTIRVEWREGSRAFRYEGVRTGQGHFMLRGDGHAGSATLHRFQYSNILEGFWQRKGKSGFWRVHLPQALPTKVTRLP